MAVTTKPLVEITQEAMGILCREMGIVNTLRFINQFSAGYGDYTKDRAARFDEMSLDEIVDAIEQDRTNT